MRSPAHPLAPLSAAATPGIERALFWLFVIALAWTPFWFGSNTLLAWGINAVAFPGIAALYEINLLASRQRHPVALKRIAVPAALFAAVALWTVVQAAAWTPLSLHHPIWAMTATAIGRTIAGSISVDRDLTALALLRLMTAATVFWLALQFGRDAARANNLMLATAAVCTGYSAYGLISIAATPGYVLWVENPYMHGFVTSTFYNRNNFATYGGMGLVLLCGLIMRLYRHELTAEAPSRRFRIASFIETTGEKGAIYIGAAFIVMVAVLLSGSRGGIVATCLGVFTLVVLTIGRSKGRAGDRRNVIVFSAFAVALVFLFYGDTFIGKLSQQGFGDDARIAVYNITVRSILDSPLTGYGYGTFRDIFPMFRDRSIIPAGVWEMAHNTYLEIFQGLGLIFGTMLIAAVGLLAFYCFRGAARRKVGATLPAVAASTALLLGSNALVDFSLQIQAVTLTFMAILGAGVAQSESSRVAAND